MRKSKDRRNTDVPVLDLCEIQWLTNIDWLIYIQFVFLLLVYTLNFNESWNFEMVFKKESQLSRAITYYNIHSYFLLWPDPNYQ